MALTSKALNAVKLQKKTKRTVEDKIDGVRIDLMRLIDLWKETKGFLLKAFLNKPITDEEEARFLTLKTTLASLSKNLDARTQDYLSVGADEIAKIMNSAVNLKVLSQITAISKKGLYGKWHVAYIQMHRTLGALEFFRAGYRPQKAKKQNVQMLRLASKLSNIFGSELREKTGDSDEESVWTKLMIVVAGLIAAGLMLYVGLYYF